jgi:hypothetical protein
MGVYPASSPKHPPPVESPALVPDFALAWTRAYQKAKAKVGILAPLTRGFHLSPHLASYDCLYNDEQPKWLGPIYVPRLRFSSSSAACAVA